MRLILNHFNSEYDLDSTQGAHILFSVLKLLPPLSANGPWIAGGAIRDLILNQIPKDFDVYFQSEPQREHFIDGLLKSGWIERPAEFVKKRNKDPLKPYKVREFTRLVEHEGLQKTVIVQTIDFIDYANPIKVIAGFDFTCNQLITDGVNIYTGLQTMADLNGKLLRPFNFSDKTPEQFWFRLSYFLSKGFKIESNVYHNLTKAFGELIQGKPGFKLPDTKIYIQELEQAHKQAIEACTPVINAPEKDDPNVLAERKRQALKRLFEMDDQDADSLPIPSRIKVRIPKADKDSDIWTEKDWGKLDKDITDYLPPKSDT